MYLKEPRFISKIVSDELVESADASFLHILHMNGHVDLITGYNQHLCSNSSLEQNCESLLGQITKTNE